MSGRISRHRRAAHRQQALCRGTIQVCPSAARIVSASVSLRRREEKRSGAPSSPPRISFTSTAPTGKAKPLSCCCVISDRLGRSGALPVLRSPSRTGARRSSPHFIRATTEMMASHRPGSFSTGWLVCEPSVSSSAAERFVPLRVVSGKKRLRRRRHAERGSSQASSASMTTCGQQLASFMEGVRKPTRKPVKTEFECSLTPPPTHTGTFGEIAFPLFVKSTPTGKSVDSAEAACRPCPTYSKKMV